MLVVAAPAAAARSCARQVIDDWYDNGRVDRTYPLHCYDDAIEALQPDLREYSSAEEEITRALQRRGRTKSNPPPTTQPPPDDREVSGRSPGLAKKPPKAPKSPTTIVDHPKNESPEVATPIDSDSESASSVPIPLLVLTGLALLLLAGGSAGYFVRRYQDRG